MPSNASSSVIRFAPLYQERVWGGRHMESLYGRKLPDETAAYGESWEICDRPEAQSLILEGKYEGWTLHELWQKARTEVFGLPFKDHAAERFPLLIKILDAQDNLSVQVHPDDRTAPLLHGEAKSEAWFVTHATPQAKLYAGLRPGTTAEVFARGLADGTMMNLVNTLTVAAGDCLDIPGGTLHAIGAGLVIFEIQQNSDTTYRIFDWNRPGLDGKARPLHPEQSMQALNFELPPCRPQRLDHGGIFEGSYFQLKLSRLRPSETFELPVQDKFSIGAVVSGAMSMAGERFTPGDFFLVPASLTAEARSMTATAQEVSLLWITL
ncbi:class I mannose-6-phosphate isomerase [soil metagenome]